MKTYSAIITFAIIFIFVAGANASPKPESGYRGHDEKRGQHESGRGDKKRGYDDHGAHGQNKRRDNHQGRRDGRKSEHEQGHSNYHGQAKWDRKQHPHAGQGRQAPARSYHQPRAEKHHRAHRPHQGHYIKRTAHHQHRNHPVTHRTKHKSHSNVHWNIVVDVPVQQYRQYSYYQWGRGGECFRVDERADRTVWVEVPYYKCP